MIFSEMQVPANPAGAARLDRAQIWQGLEQKALDAVPYVEAITSCREINRLGPTVFDREIELAGARYVERVWLEEPTRVVFTRSTARYWARSPTRSSRTATSWPCGSSSPSRSAPATNCRSARTSWPGRW